MLALILCFCLILFAGQQPVIEPMLIVGRAGENVTITCIVGDSEPSSTMILTDNSQQLMINSQDLQNDRVVYTYGPLVPGDEGRMVICQYGVEQAPGSISVLCKSICMQVGMCPHWSVVVVVDIAAITTSRQT